MKIESFAIEPFARIPFLNAGKGAGSYYVEQLPVHVARLTQLPEELDAILVTADLQGRERFEEAKAGAPRLLGETLPGQLAASLLPELGVSPERTGVILAGDFYTVPNLDKRGGSGDVTEVWRAFASQFKWVIGVAGNHDTFGDSMSPSCRIAANANYLDGESVVVDGISVGGIGGVIGNPRKPQRRTDQDYVDRLEELLSRRPDIVVMHDGPDDPENGQRGSPRIRNTLEQHAETLVIRGHVHWEQPVTQLANGSQVLDVDCRVAILRR